MKHPPPRRAPTRRAASYGTPEIVNTGQGGQFTAEEFTRVVLAAGAKLPMDGRGEDDVLVERLWRSLKYERVYLKGYNSVGAARADSADYLAWYNAHRAHSSLERLTPDEAYLHEASQVLTRFELSPNAGMLAALRAK